MAATTTTLDVRPVGGALGAEMHGVDLGELGDDEFGRIHDALMDHLVLFFPGQQLTLEQHRDFAARFGPLENHPYLHKVDESIGEIVQIDDKIRADTWHTDVTFSEHPPIASVVHYAGGPDHGGDTMWSNQYLAYETLTPPIRDLVDGLTAGHDSGLYGQPEVQATHPVVRVHPVTGRRCLYVNRTWTHHITELTRYESEALLDFLYAHSEEPHLTVRWRWTPGDVAIWDNRCTQHIAVNDFGDEPRLLHRATILGDDPQNPDAPRWEPYEETSISARAMLPLLKH